MSLESVFGRIWNPDAAARADNANSALSQALAPGSDYWKSGQLTGDQGVISGAAQLAANKVGVNTSNMDSDTAATSALGAQFGNIAQNGGQLTDAVLAQARSDLANTNVHQLDQASRQQAAQVLAQDSAERNWAAQHQNQTRAQALANQLQKQLFNTSISHANFESALNAHALQLADRNAAFNLANEVAVGGRNTANNQQTLGRAQQAQDFSNAMTTAQMAGGALSAGGALAASMMKSDGEDEDEDKGTTSKAKNNGNTSGYYMLGAALRSAAVNSKPAPTQSKYTNPITGNTVNANTPSDASAWGDWLTGTSTLVGA